MTQNDQLAELAHIRGLMDRSTRFLSLSGLSGVVAGAIAIAGVTLARYHITQGLAPDADVLTYGTERGYSPVDDLRLTLIMDAAVVLCMALLGAFWFTWRRSRRTGQYLWDASARRLMVNLFVPLGVGGVFCLALFYYGLPGLVAPATLMFYGLALFSASKYTLDEIRWLGVSELVLGVVALFWLDAALLFWALGFGVLHIFYGGLMYLRYERDSRENV
ncbi:MAG: hypothetical protein IPG10_06780 [Flavobacteriales bacterium]|jgi:hypothetical protein|nr:hypothetical protein [Flavobacteriales bacterium]MBK7085364.1 hypothetical protein [Flavobacteriales bacterium]MBK7268532.1 hypothetical protein [Flavobacteriales bacterium]MBK7753046.1 hypothetical protein [Flavobacteriales bacterium]MBK9076074.1 hypothetical protein [Flavobacteriales bacterium]